MTAPAPSTTARSQPLVTARALLALTKPRVTWLVSFSAVVGLWLAPVAMGPVRALVVFLAITGLVGSANALNCVLERDVDALMRRTAGRPLPAGLLSPTAARLFGVALGAFSLALVWAASNTLTALLGLAARVGYVAVYTPMKRRSPWALLVGAVPGALPPLMGWTAATGRLDPAGLALFGLLFLWQVPHFAAIALLQRDDYARAGLRVWPVVYGERATWQLALVGALGMVPLAVGMWLLGVASAGYALVGAALTGWVAWRALEGLRQTPAASAERRRTAALRLLKGTLVQLPALLAALALLAR